MKKPKIPKARAWALACEAVEAGARYSVNRLWKYAPAPKGWRDSDADRLVGLIVDNVKLELAERFDFD